MSSQHDISQEPAPADEAEGLEFDPGHVMTLEQHKRLTSELAGQK